MFRSRPIAPVSGSRPLREELVAALSKEYRVHAYGKWRGAHWRLTALLDLGVETGHPGAVAAAKQTLDWLASSERLRRIRKRVLAGRVRRCASQDGLGLYNCLRVGLDDPRLDTLAESLVETQWPDGGWNCDVRPEASHSSFNESWGPLLGLAAYGAKDAAAKTAEFFLLHRVYKSHRTGAPAHPAVLNLRYPPYWHFDVLVGLVALERSVGLGDARTADALDYVESKRGPDGTWHVEGKWWKCPGSNGSGVEAVDWGETADKLLTQRAKSVLDAAGR